MTTKSEKAYSERTWLYRFFIGHSYGRDVLRLGWGYLIVSIFIISCLAMVVVGINSAHQYFERRECSALESFGEVHDYRWDYWTGCRVQTTEGYWIDADSPRLQEVTGDLDLGGR